jgi:hypothetical protein
MTPLSQTMPYPWHRWVKLCCIHDTAEPNYAVSMTPLSQTMWYPWHCWVKLCCISWGKLCCILNIIESIWAISLRPLSKAKRYLWHCCIETVQYLIWRQFFYIFWAISSFFFKGGFGKIICRYSCSTKTYTIIILKTVVTLKEPSRQITFAFA